MKNYVIVSVLAVLFLFSLFLANSSSAVDSCTPVDKYITKSSDSTSEEVNFDFQSSDHTVVISADSGYSITEVWLDVEDDGHGGYHQYGSSAGTYNPNPGNDIDSARVRVVKTCVTPTASATATATATGASKVYVCKYVGTPGVDESLQTGQNPIEVSINTLPSGWSVGSYFADAHGRSFVLATVPQVPEPDVNDCPSGVVGSATPTATATSVPTATPTQAPCEGRECGQETATPTATPTEIPNNDICANIDGIQTSLPEGSHLDASGKNCVWFGVPGVPQSSSTSTGQVLGASTMAGTGALSDSIFYSMFTLGSLLSSLGIMKNGKKRA